ncbi:telomeric repeat-binding factor 2-like [Zootoca vivipara]|uniref:telomeric repeat-binding factor 2-like n=1 Tax=Zootoca vivipara TaxID=8524 RepID=UPI001592AB73|nr:telomeric repeat-binding factor 2-like [Zootoca vivipara]
MEDLGCGESLEGAAAAARENTLEAAVNRWALLFYAHQAIQAFSAGHSQDFRQLRNIIYAVLARPLMLEKRIAIQMWIIQLLSRIDEDFTIDIKTKLTPLEYALVLLDEMKNELDIDVIEEMRREIMEAAVITCLKNEAYGQAREILNKHLTKDPSSQEMRSTLQSIIEEKTSTHPAICNFSYDRFQQRILLHLESCLSDSEPFLLEMAKKDLENKIEPRLNPLEMATKEEMVKNTPEQQMLYPESVRISDETLEESRSEGGPKKILEMPLMEAKEAILEFAFEFTEVADVYQAASKLEEETSGAAEPTVVTDATVSAASSDSDRLAKRRRHDEDELSGLESKEGGSGDDSVFFSSSSGGSSSSSTSFSGPKRKMWTSEESQWIKKGVKMFGEGKWKAISQAFPFKNRTAGGIKDRWRTMKKRNLENDLEATTLHQNPMS